jgi:hypothetical protein
MTTTNAITPTTPTATTTNPKSPWVIESTVFKHPFTSMIVGPTQSGKTCLVKNILKNLNYLIDKEIESIYFCYSEWQHIYDELKLTIVPQIIFIKGLLELDIINKEKNNLIILDDLMTECENESSILKLFTVDSHHKNASVMLITQNLFSKGKNARTISLNSNYLICFSNKRDQSQIRILGQQMFPDNFKFFREAFEDATSVPHGYLFMDLRQSTKAKNMLQTGILPDEARFYYTAKNISI